MVDPDAPQSSSAEQTFLPELCPPKDRRFILIAAILASALGFIDGTIVAIAVPAIRETLNADLAQAQWMHNAYMLTLTSLMLIGGALGDRFGTAKVFRFGIALFVLASLGCAASVDAPTLIMARALQGVGAAIMIPGSLAIIARTYPNEVRAKAIGTWAAASAVTTALGPIIGGLALSIGGPDMWRWIFAVNIPLGGLSLWLLSKPRYAPRVPRTANVDLPGIVTVAFALFAIAWGLTSNHANAFGPDLNWIGAGFAALGLFVAIEARTSEPMLPLTLFKSRTFAFANLMSFALYAAMSIMFFFLPMAVISTWGVREIEAAASFAPLSIFIATLSTRSSILAARFGPARVLAWGSCSVATGFALIAMLAPQQNYWGHVLPAMCLVGIGMGLCVAPLSTAVMGAVDERQSGIASGVNNAISRLASLIGVAAVSGTTAIIYSRAGGTASFGVYSPIQGHVIATNTAFQSIMWIAAILAVFSALLALAIRSPRS